MITNDLFLEILYKNGGHKHDIHPDKIVINQNSMTSLVEDINKVRELLISGHWKPVKFILASLIEDHLWVLGRTKNHEVHLCKYNNIAAPIHKKWLTPYYLYELRNIEIEECIVLDKA